MKRDIEQIIIDHRTRRRQRLIGSDQNDQQRDQQQAHISSSNPAGCSHASLLTMQGAGTNESSEPQDSTGMDID